MQKSELSFVGRDDTNSGIVLYDLFHYMSSGIIICHVKNQGRHIHDYIITGIGNSEQMLKGEKRSASIGQCLGEVVPEFNDPQILSHLGKAVANGRPSKFRKNKENSANWCEFQLFLLASRELAIVYEDITDQVLGENRLRASEEKYRTLIENMSEVVYTLDSAAKITYISPNIHKLSGYNAAQILGREFTDFVHPEDLAGRLTNFRQALTGRSVRTEYRMLTSDGRTVWVSTNAAPVWKNGKITGIQGILTDITARKQTEMENFYLNSHDPLTGLYNRRFIEKSLLETDIPANYPLAVVVIDVIGLKLTNDAFGYTAGDLLLKEVASILKRCCQQNCLIGRTGGDDFAIILKNTDEKAADKTVRQIEKLADRSASGSSVISLSIGFAVKFSAGQKIEEIRTKAENMMYRNKLRHGKTMRSRTIETVLRSINNKYDQEQIHTERVALYCEKIARAMKLTEAEIEIVKTAGILHDIGKIMVPASLLNKPGRLSEEEFALIRKHPETSCIILREVEEYSPLAEIVLYHHERWDGRGYPYKLQGEQIPLISRIISVADAYEAMTADRPYQKRKSKEQALQEIEDNAGRQFDPYIARLFIRLICENP